jgi:uncharacterized protein
MSKTNTYQCSIHGAIEFPGNLSGLNELVKSLIDTPEMQRLRHSIVNSQKEAEFYVTMDISRRKTYKQEDAIWLFSQTKEAKTLQEDESSRIIQVVREQHEIEFLMVPAEIAQELTL